MAENEPMANRPFENLHELEGALVERCVALVGDPELIRSHANYHWWPQLCNQVPLFTRNPYEAPDPPGAEPFRLVLQLAQGQDPEHEVGMLHSVKRTELKEYAESRCRRPLGQ